MNLRDLLLDRSLTAWQVEACVSGQLNGLSQSGELWCIRPHLVARMRVVLEGRHKKALRRTTATWKHLLVQGWKSAPAIADGMAFWTVFNDGKSVEPFLLPSRDSWTRNAALAPIQGEHRKAEALSVEILRSLGGQEIASAKPWLQSELLWASVAIRRALKILGERDPRFVVTANQQSLPMRAVILAARQLEIPTIYVPHAPFASNPTYADLPVDYALLRGRMEVGSYRQILESHGCNPGAVYLHSIGCPSMSDPIDSRRTTDVIVAPSPWSLDFQTDFFSALSLLPPRQVVFCPHPNMRPSDYDGLADPRFRRPSGFGSLNQIRRGIGAVVQSSSGVALEAMLHGVPVVQIDLSGLSRNYPFLDDRFILPVHDAQGVKDAVCDALDLSKYDGQGAQDWALEWCSPFGTQALERFSDIVSGKLLSSGALFDRWSASLA